MKIHRTIWSTLMVLIALIAPLGAQQAGSAARGLAAQGSPEFPDLTGRVVDEAEILSPTTRVALDAKLAALQAKSTDQVAVVTTLKSLRGRTIEDYGIALGRHWQIGQAVKNNGVVLLVAPNERKVRIEVGYGIEGVLSDAVTKLIIDSSILPRFRDNDFPTGITRGVDDIVDVLTGDAAEWKRRAQPVPATASGAPTSFGMAVVQFVAVLFFASVATVFFGAWAFVFFCLFVRFATWIDILPGHKNRTGILRWLNFFDPQTNKWATGTYAGSSASSPSDWSSSSSSSSDSSGGGGDFGGGGSSGNW